MATNAPTCHACNRPTWNPSGYCHLHINMSGNAQAGNNRQSARETYAPRNESGYLNDPREIANSFTKVFDEIDIATPYSMNQASEQTIKGFVSLEAMRRFPDSDVPNSSERIRIIQEIEAEVIDEVQVYASSNYSDDMMVGFRDSSEDQYGMGKDEAMIIASFAMRREWEMGRATGETENSRGVPYSMPLEKYMLYQRAHLQNVARVEFRRNLAFYPQIIQNSSGRLPQNNEDVLSDRMRQHLLDDSIPHEHKLSENERKEHRENVVRVESKSNRGQVLGALGMVAGALAVGAAKGAANYTKREVGAMNNFRKGAEDRLTQMERERMQRQDEEYRRMMHRKRKW